jgi:carbon storage regulator
MLVLSRKKSEVIVIDPRTCPVDELGRIRIVLVELRGDKCRIGIEAPRAVSVHREEVQLDVDRKSQRVA